MNIIQLFCLLDLKRDQILEFGSEDYIRIEKKINVEKKINPEINSNTSEKLILALKEYKEELLFIVSNRILFNFFTHNNFSKNHFSEYNLTVSDDKIKQFISLFLADDLVSFFSLKLSKTSHDNLEELDLLLGLKRYFPEEVIYSITPSVFSKLDFAISKLSTLDKKAHIGIYYIEFKVFYDLLSHFASIELDRKVSNFLSLVVDFYKKNINYLFYNSVIKSMGNYNAVNEILNKTLIKNREAVSVSRQKTEVAGEYSALHAFIFVICILMPLLLSKCS